ncbi:Nramp family divalent metal transporter [Sporomusa acidovorans]|uniref:Divalent metal cation transporter MntH n=1 Tax=Sporomusa acidovorans (strain ATCC 49682 / DSM 3132 / Mol) TaxID=1123286 RepID=A0ABZ3J2G6_SPOA4|nr:Nramp family divalent metal transporter [Sporomusa acidovorans]OZC23241.1 divalent metal cation transporter MntH [Sporomusa acidovorans DSM 3132]SDE98460.1 manganese transport protein [Sporomusa acidovorans]
MKEEQLSLPVLAESGDVKDKAKGIFKYFGPAFIVSVAYMDPGNFGTNIAGGSQFAYNLIWVILWSNFMAIFVQILSAKLGIATGIHLPDHCGKIFSRPVNWGLWSIATVAAMATDLAEFLGGVLGFHLLFGIPLVWSAVLTGVITYGICHMQKYGQQIVEHIITGMVAVISIAYVWEMFIAKPDWSQVAYHVAVPMLTPDSVLVAVGMLGATVMPHVIYLHSHLVQTRRTECMEDCRRHLKMAKIDVFVAMNMAFIVNAAMVIVSAAVFNGNGLNVNSIEAAYMTLQPLMGNMAAGAFGLALLASGLSSSTVGTMAGEVILGGFVGFDIPASIRRLITMIPGLAILMSGINPMEALVYSQVSLSFALPAAIIPLMIVTNKANIMGRFKNGFLTNCIGWVIVSIILVLNVVLLYLTLTG